MQSALQLNQRKMCQCVFYILTENNGIKYINKNMHTQYNKSHICTHNCACVHTHRHTPTHNGNNSLTPQTSMGALPWTCRSKWKCPSRCTGNPHKWLASQKIWCVEELETLPAGTKPMTSHHWLPKAMEERGMQRGSTQQSSLKGWERAIISQMNMGTVSKATLGKLLRDEVEHKLAFLSA